jgi:hypothetical protein
MTEQLDLFSIKQEESSNSTTLIGRRLRYNRDNMVTVIDENHTHVLVRFDSGAKICTPKYSFEFKK